MMAAGSCKEILVITSQVPAGTSIADDLKDSYTVAPGATLEFLSWIFCHL